MNDTTLITFTVNLRADGRLVSTLTAVDPNEVIRVIDAEITNHPRGQYYYDMLHAIIGVLEPLQRNISVRDKCL